MERKSKVKELMGNTVLFTISSIGTKIISFLFIPLYTAVLSTKEYGMADYIISLSLIIVPIITLNIKDAVLRFAFDESLQRNKVLSTGLGIILCGHFFLMVIIVALKLFRFISKDNIFLLWVVLLCFISALNEIFTMYLKACEQVRTIVVGGLAGAVASAISNIVFLLIFHFGFNGYLISYTLGLGISLIIFCCFGKKFRISNPIADIRLLESMVKFSSPLIVNALAWWINNLSDRFFIIMFCGAAVNGVYSIAYKIPVILSTIQAIFYNAWSVSAIKEFDKDDTDGFIGKVYDNYSAVSAFVATVLLALNIPLARLMYAKDFFDAYKYVPFLIFGTVFNGLALFEGCLFTAAKKTKEVSKTTIIGAIINTGLNIGLIPRFGAYGAAIATAAGYFFIWLIRTISLKRIIAMTIYWGKQIAIYLFLAVQVILLFFNAYIWQWIPVIAIIYLIRHNIVSVAKTLLVKVYDNKI